MGISRYLFAAGQETADKGSVIQYHSLSQVFFFTICVLVSLSQLIQVGQ